jgi:hypothetical protein
MYSIEHNDQQRKSRATHVKNKPSNHSTNLSQRGASRGMLAKENHNIYKSQNAPAIIQAKQQPIEMP